MNWLLLAPETTTPLTNQRYRGSVPAFTTVALSKTVAPAHTLLTPAMLTPAVTNGLTVSLRVLEVAELNAQAVLMVSLQVITSLLAGVLLL